MRSMAATGPCWSPLSAYRMHALLPVPPRQHCKYVPCRASAWDPRCNQTRGRRLSSAGCCRKTGSQQGSLSRMRALRQESTAAVTRAGMREFDRCRHCSKRTRIAVWPGSTCHRLPSRLLILAHFRHLTASLAMERARPGRGWQPSLVCPQCQQSLHKVPHARQRQRQWQLQQRHWPPPGLRRQLQWPLGRQRARSHPAGLLRGAAWMEGTSCHRHKEGTTIGDWGTLAGRWSV